MTALGTPDYLAPEQALGLAITPAADMFALGSVLAFAASGRAPFTAPSVPYILFNIAQLADLSGVPEPLYELIAACLRKDPAARPTPGQMLEYLGGPPSAPAPWPAPVLDGIGRPTGPGVAVLAVAAGRRAGGPTGAAEYPKSSPVSGNARARHRQAGGAIRPAAGARPPRRSGARWPAGWRRCCSSSAVSPIGPPDRRANRRR